MTHPILYDTVCPFIHTWGVVVSRRVSPVQFRSVHHQQSRCASPSSSWLSVSPPLGLVSRMNGWMNEWTGLTDTIDGNWTGGPTVCVLLHGYLTQPNPTQANLIPPPKKHVMNEFISEGWRMKVQNLVSYHLFHTQPHTVRVQSKSWVNEDKR